MKIKPPKAKRAQSKRKYPAPELRQCPFCGQLPHWVSHFESSFWVECQTYDCWVAGPHAPYSESAIRRWNKRPIEK